MIKKQIRSRHYKVDEAAYDTIHKLREVPGMTQPIMAKVTGYGESTIWRVCRFNTYKEFDADREANTQMQRTKLQSKTPSTTKIKEEDATEPVAKEKQEKAPEWHQAEYDRLDRIALALERLADAWEQAPEKKKGIFG